jgi:hypothetical protein
MLETFGPDGRFVGARSREFRVVEHGVAEIGADEGCTAETRAYANGADELCAGEIRVR